MRNITLDPKYVTTVLLMWAILFTVNSVSAQVKTTFSPRYSEKVNGDIAIIANNVVSEHATNGYNGEGDNNSIFSVFVDIDMDASTFNSSSANLANPSPSSSCLSFKKAYLYWAAANKENGPDNNGNDTGNGLPEVNWPYDQVKLMLPGSTTYNTITADEVIYNGRAEHFVNDPYVCVKDITADVQGLANPYGKFQVANIKATVGNLWEHIAIGNRNTGTSGGWQIVFVYESPQLKNRNITLFDGYANVTQTDNSFDILFDGFQTVPNGPVNANIVIGSTEGDRGIHGDQLQIFDTDGNWTPISTNERVEDNFFNSKITVNETPFLDRNPASTNTLGFDASLFELRNTGRQLIDNNQTSANFRLTSNQETYGLYLLGLSVEVFEPSLGALSFTTNVVGSNFDPGDDAPVEIRVKNVGNDNIQNLEIALTLPPQVEFLNTEPLPSGVTYTFDLGTRELRFYVEDGYTDTDDPEYELDFNLFINHECITCSAAIGLQALATFTGENNSNMVGTLSSGTVDACGIGNHDPTYLYVTPVLSINDASAVEGNNINFTISSSHLLAEDALLNLVYSNITASASDYAIVNTYTVPIGTGNTSFNIPAIDDHLIETTETFDIEASSSANITLLDDTATGSILDNDLINGTGISVTDTNIIVTEGTDVFAVFNIVLNGDITENVTVDFTTNTGTANSPEDYITTTGTLTFTPTIGSLDIPVTITDDSLTELQENFSLTLSNIQSNLGVGFVDGQSTNTANGTINDDDMGQIMVASYEETVTIMCGDAIPDVPTLIFTGGCGNYSVDFTEVEDFSGGIDDFQILRTWLVTDVCGNTASFEQIIYVLQRERSLIEIDICVEDNEIDLIDYLPAGFNTNGTFTLTEGDSTIDGSTFDPNGLELGAYLITYEATTGACTYIVDFVIRVNADCLPCDVNDLVVSKTITVNGDGINDFFEISGMEECGYTYHLQVFNRWGTMVYESNEYRNNWGGNAPGGSFGTHSVVPTGTYYYIIAFSNLEIKPVNGYIYIGSN